MVDSCNKCRSSRAALCDLDAQSLHKLLSSLFQLDNNIDVPCRGHGRQGCVRARHVSSCPLGNCHLMVLRCTGNDVFVTRDSVLLRPAHDFTLEAHAGVSA